MVEASEDEDMEGAFDGVYFEPRSVSQLRRLVSFVVAEAPQLRRISSVAVYASTVEVMVVSSVKCIEMRKNK